MRPELSESNRAAVQVICRGCNSKVIRTPLNYLIGNQLRMAYTKLMTMKLPIESGAIEKQNP